MIESFIQCSKSTVDSQDLFPLFFVFFSLTKPNNDLNQHFQTHCYHSTSTQLKTTICMGAHSLSKIKDHTSSPYNYIISVLKNHHTATSSTCPRTVPFPLCPYPLSPRIIIFNKLRRRPPPAVVAGILREYVHLFSTI